MNLTTHRAVFRVLCLLALILSPVALAQPGGTWSQPPGFLIYTNDPDLRGGNRPSNFDWNASPQTNHPAVADDFIADAYRILRVRWWGSYLPDYEPASGTNFFEEAYALSFFLDRTNRPSALVGTYIAPITTVTILPTSFTGADGHRIYQYEVALNQTCLAYEGLPDAELAGFHGTESRRYWLSIQAAVGRRYSATTNQSGSVEWTHEPTAKTATNNFWGWHTTPTNRASASVSGHLQLSDTNLVFSTWHTNTPLHTELDQAFQIFTGCDNTPPRIISVTGYCSANILKVLYSEKVEPHTAGDFFNYSMVGTANDGFDINGAWVDGRAVWLTINAETPVPCNSALLLTANSIWDLCNNEMVSGNSAFECAPCVDPLPGLCPTIHLNYDRVGPFVSLFWNSDKYALQHAVALSGPWTVIASRSPLVLDWGTVTSFYRLVCLNSP